MLPRGLHLAESNLEARFAELRIRRLTRWPASGSRRRRRFRSSRLWLTDLDSPAFRPLPGTDGASFPFWSPDSEYIGFVAAGKLKKIRASGGEAMTVSERAFRTSAWSRDNVILFSPAPSSGSIACRHRAGSRHPSRPSTRRAAKCTTRIPSFFLTAGTSCTSASARKRAPTIRAVCISARWTEQKPILLLPDAMQARYANGHVLFVRNGTLIAQPFDAERLELRGAPVPLVEQLKALHTGATGVTGEFSVSDNGVLAYQTASASRVTAGLVRPNGQANRGRRRAGCRLRRRGAFARRDASRRQRRRP